MARKTVTSSKVKSRWNRRHYDRFSLMMPKGYKAKIDAYVAETGRSFNGFINELGRIMTGTSKEDWKPLYVDED